MATGLTNRPDPETIDRVKAATNSGECYERAAEALAFAEERIILGSVARAQTAMRLAGEYRQLGKVMAANEVGDFDG